MSMPWNCEQDTSVAGVRHHDGAVAGQKLGAENEVDTLTGRDQRLHLGFRQLSKQIAKRTGSIDDDARAGVKFFAALCIPRENSIYEALRIFGNTVGWRVIQ